MYSKNPAKPRYPTCEGIKRPKMDESYYQNNELLEKLAKDYTVSPLFERYMSEQAMKEQYSLKNNHFLACRWREYKNRAGARLRQPAQFPRVADFHFHNGYSCYKPSESITNRKTNRLSLTPEPGIDNLGSIPLPIEAYNFRPLMKTVDKAGSKRTNKKIVNKNMKMTLKK